MVTISFYAMPSQHQLANGSGLFARGLESQGGGIRVGELGQFMQVNSNGVFVAEANGCFPLGASGVLFNGVVTATLQELSHTSGNLNIRFEHDEEVRVQNGILSVSGMVFSAAELKLGGSGDPTWSEATLALSASPGISGMGDGSASSRHDFYVAMTSGPLATGLQNSQMRFGVEYL